MIELQDEQTPTKNKITVFLKTFGKYFFPCFLTIFLFIIIIFGILLPKIENNNIVFNKKMLIQIMDATKKRLEILEKRHSSGELTLKQAQQKAYSYYSNLRFGNKNKDYFWIINSKGILIFHPFLKHLENTNIEYLKDINNKKFVSDILKNVSPNKPYFNYYHWQWKNNKNIIAPKISFSKLFKPWKWIIITGVYIDDIEYDITNLKKDFLTIGFLILMAVSIILMYIIFQWIETESLHHDTEQKLLTQEKYYTTIFESSGNAILVMDKNANILDFNHSAQHLLNLTSDPLEENPPLKFDIFSEENNIIKASLKECIKTGHSNFELNITPYKSQDLLIPVDITLSYIPDNNESKFFCMIRDVSVTRRNLAIIKMEKAFTEKIIETSPAYFFAVNLSGNIIRMNTAMLKALDATKEQVLNKNFIQSFIPDDEQEKMISQTNFIIKNGFSNGNEAHLLCTNGAKRFVKFYCRAVEGMPMIPSKNSTEKPDKNFSEGYIFGFVIDITDKQKTQDELAAKEKHLRLTLDSIGDAVIVTDSQNKIIRINNQAILLTGFSAIDAKKEKLGDIFKLLDFDTGQPAKLICTTTGTAAKANLISKHKTEHIISYTLSDIKDDYMNQRGSILIFNDITADIEIQEQLKHSQKMDSIGQLAGGVAHDFNNMLCGIMNSAEMLALELDEKSESSEYLEFIIKSTEKAADLTKKLLSFSRKGNTRVVIFNVNHNIKEAVNLLQHTIDKKIRVDLDLTPELLFIKGDESQVQHAFLNLGINARDAMPQGGILTFKTRRKQIINTEDNPQALINKKNSDHSQIFDAKMQTGDYIEISVSDTGKGIPEELFSKIFEPFFTTKEIGKGTGLGLASVYGTIKEHKGYISFESKLGKGTKFKIYIPISSEKI